MTNVEFIGGPCAGLNFPITEGHLVSSLETGFVLREVPAPADRDERPTYRLLGQHDLTVDFPPNTVFHYYDADGDYTHTDQTAKVDPGEVLLTDAEKTEPEPDVSFEKMQAEGITEEDVADSRTEAPQDE